MRAWRPLRSRLGEVPDINPLPVDAFVADIVERVRASRAAVVTAPPGAGKTTRIPPALIGDGPVILLQPRRLAARSIAARIADERGWTLGREVGWQVRFERRSAKDTRLLVVTEGILTARLQTDPLLSEFTTIVLDEFHERSIHADVAIALARQAWRARDDLRLVVMSATLDSSAVSAFLDDCPVIDVPGRAHPIEIAYAPGQSVADAAADALGASSGDVLCFLPGAPDIRRAMNDLQARVGGGASPIHIVPLHGSLDADMQDFALRPSSSSRRIIVATNIAETSLTVPRVTAVVDTGLHKVARYDAERGIDSLEIERITADAAEQRAGRAGRLAPGVVRRLWDARDRLRPHREPEIHRIDLSSACLDVIAWGGDPRALEWFERPRDEALDAAMTLLARLGLVEVIQPESVRNPQSGPREPQAALSSSKGGFRNRVRLTKLGEQVHRLPLHPRLARMLVAAGGARPIARACALLSERHLLPPRAESTTSDLLSALDNWGVVPGHVKRVADVIADLGSRIADVELGNADLELRKADSMSNIPQSDIRNPKSEMSSEASFRRAILSGYPDRVAQRREPGSANVRLASGTGATIAPESGVRDGEFLVALDVSRVAQSQSGLRGPQAALSSSKGEVRKSEIRDPQFARVRIASRVEREWLVPTASELVHRFDAATGKVRAVMVARYDALVLAERPASIDSEIAAQLLADAWLARGPREDDVRLLRRMKFAGREVHLEELVRTAAYGARTIADVDIARALPADTLRALDRDAPESLLVPSGRHRRLEYQEDGTVSAEVKLQEVFGLAETPRIGPRREPVLLALTAPNGRPVQLTRDLRSFWDRTYPEVRKELRGRYPKHPWPEDPWAAPPTARASRRK